MSTSLYENSIPYFLRQLSTLSHILTKGEEHSKANSIPESKIIESRIHEDMLPLPFQIRFACGSYINYVHNVTGIEKPTFEDKESTFAELQQRIKATVEFLEAVPKDALEGKETAKAVMVTPKRELTFTGQSFLQKYAIPNSTFHVSIAYAILRNVGVPIGKMDFLGDLP